MGFGRLAACGADARAEERLPVGVSEGARSVVGVLRGPQAVAPSSAPATTVTNSTELSVALPILLTRTVGRDENLSDQLVEVLKHRYIYVPRGTKKDTIQPGKRLGLAVARERRARLTVVAPQKSSATHHPELAKLEIVTERSGHVRDGGVVLAWCPTYKAMEKVQQLERSVVVLIEWIPGEFEAWAKLVGGYNVVTGEIMDTALSTEALKALEGIVREGYNGWTRSIDEQLVTSYLRDLAKAGAYDRELVLAYARQTKSEHSIERLKKILNKFEVLSESAAPTSALEFPTSRHR